MVYFSWEVSEMEKTTGQKAVPACRQGRVGLPIAKATFAVKIGEEVLKDFKIFCKEHGINIVSLSKRRLKKSWKKRN